MVPDLQRANRSMPSDFDRQHASGIRESLTKKLEAQKKTMAHKMSPRKIKVEGTNSRGVKVRDYRINHYGEFGHHN